MCNHHAVLQGVKATVDKMVKENLYSAYGVETRGQASCVFCSAHRITLSLRNSERAGEIVHALPLLFVHQCFATGPMSKVGVTLYTFVCACYALSRRLLYVGSRTTW